jgi:hypothetical protein
MNYLLYIEHSAENLQFYMWHQDYLKRFKEAPASERNLAPEWTKAMEDEIAVRLQKETTENSRKEPVGASEIFKGTDFEKKRGDIAKRDSNPFATPPPTAISFGDRDSYAASTQTSYATTYRSQASDAFASAGAKTPCKAKRLIIQGQVLTYPRVLQSPSNHSERRSTTSSPLI